jgi:hypothetical protein
MVQKDEKLMTRAGIRTFERNLLAYRAPTGS